MDTAYKLNNHVINAVYNIKGSIDFMTASMAANVAATEFVTFNEMEIVEYYKNQIKAVPEFKGNLFGYTHFADREYLNNCIGGMNKKHMLKKPYLMAQFNPIKLADFMEMVVYKHKEDEDYLFRRHSACHVAPSYRMVKSEGENIDFFYFCGPELVIVQLGFSTPVYYVKDVQWMVKSDYIMPTNPRIG